MKLTTLASGSKGNCYLLTGMKERIVLECGLKDNRRLVAAMGYNFDNSLCLLSHEHGDHSKNWKEVNKYTQIYCSEGTAGALGIDSVFVMSEGVKICTEEFSIYSFNTKHDCAEPLGFLIESKLERKKVLFATDTFYLKYRFKNVDLFLIECNYDYETLQANVENETVPALLENRLLSSHFSLENFSKFININAKGKLIAPVHLSRSNLNIEKMQEEIRKVGTYVNVYEQKEFNF